MNLRAIDGRRQILDAGGRGIDFKSAAGFFGGQRFAGGMRRRVGGDDLYGVAAIGQKASVERVGFVGDVVFQEEPAGFAVAAVVDRIDKLVVVLIVCAPLHANRVAIVRAGNGRFEVRGG